MVKADTIEVEVSPLVPSLPARDSSSMDAPLPLVGAGDVAATMPVELQQHRARRCAGLGLITGLAVLAASAVSGYTLVGSTAETGATADSDCTSVEGSCT